ncbi:GNAT family N-acetyltransferase [Erythrobacter sp. NAP1]|uniref:GNAT family N-acetyltransferase n=1 Tax=Erythrobacter sp. NAP1 TaxID=237727 RepID=UPI0002EA7874|nr:GNAT family N-acetyltransferase [Erythrobacter sp. NAP1]
MPDPLLRPLHAEELEQASALCLRSKAHWGYDAAFIEACRAELTLTCNDLSTSEVVVLEDGTAIIGLAQLRIDGAQSELEKLFVEPRLIGTGLGKALFAWARDAAERKGAARMVVTADPDAVPFYRSIGFEPVGEEPSGSVSGRMLPVLGMDLRQSGPGG